jgi:hypothetical protein
MKNKQLRHNMRARGLGPRFGTAVCIAFLAGPATAACITPPLSPEFVDQFKSNPSGHLIPSLDIDARTVEATARDLAGTDPALAQQLVQIAKDTRPRFKAAIAAGLAQAALACMTVDQQAALQIQQSAAAFPDGQFQALFAAVIGDLTTGDTAAAEAAASGSSGSVVVTNPNRSTPTRASGGGGGGSSNPSGSTIGIAPASTTVGISAGVFAITGPSATKGGTTPSVGRTAADPVSATR